MNSLRDLREPLTPAGSSKVFRAANLTLCATALSYAQGSCNESVLFIVACMFAAVDSALVGADDEVESRATTQQLAARLDSTEAALRLAARSFLELEQGAASRLRASAGVYAEAWDEMRLMRERRGACRG